MRNLSETEQALLERRRAGFDAFFQESRPVLVDFMKRLGFEEPHAVLLDARKFLGPLDAWMRAQVVGTDQRTWILTRLGYFIGELLNQELAGYWFLDEDPESPYFLHYVVGRFTNLPNPKARTDPFAIADRYLGKTQNRSLSSLIDNTEKELRQA